MLQMPNANQVLESVSSEVLDFRAQGLPGRLELPLVQNHHDLMPLINDGLDKESDYAIF
jgi:hypothetical protein